MKKHDSTASGAPHATATLALTASACALLANPPLAAQSPCPGVDVLATGLLNRSKVIQSPGYSSVQSVDPRSGVITPQITGLTSALDVASLTALGSHLGDLALEFSLSFPTPGPGRLQFIPSNDAPGTILTDCLITPTSLVLDLKNNRVVITELATGRLVTRALP